MLEYFNIHLVGIIYFLTADITLTSSLDGAQAACPGQVVTYTCTALRTNAIQWIVAPGVLSVTFFQDDIITEEIDGNFQVTLTSRIPNGTGTSDLTSTLRVVTTASQNGSRIQCVSGIGRVKPRQLRVVTSKLYTFLLTHQLKLGNMTSFEKTFAVHWVYS